MFSSLNGRKLTRDLSSTPEMTMQVDIIYDHSQIESSFTHITASKNISKSSFILDESDSINFNIKFKKDVGGKWVEVGVQELPGRLEICILYPYTGPIMINHFDLEIQEFIQVGSSVSGGPIFWRCSCKAHLLIQFTNIFISSPSCRTTRKWLVPACIQL